MKTGLGTFTVSDNVYKYEALAPIEGLRFGTQCAKVLGSAMTAVIDVATRWDADKMTMGELVSSISPALTALDEDKFEGLMTTAFKRVFTARNESLGDEASFNEWFSEHPGDLFPVGLMAIYYLAKDFFPRLPATNPAPSQTSAADS